MIGAAPRVPNTGPIRRGVRDWLVDTAAFVVALGWAVLIAALWRTSYLADAVHVPAALLVADVAAGVAGAAALWLRRRWPVAVALAVVPTGVFSMASGIAAVIAMFTVAVRRRPTITLLIGGLYAASAVPYFVYQVNPLQPASPYWWDVVWSAVMTGLTVGWGLFARARVQLVHSLHERAVRAETEQQLRAEQARHVERQRIAREMHDVLAHRISLVSMHAGGLEFRSDASPEEVAEAAKVIRRSAHDALEDLRQVIGVLRGDEPGGDTRPQPTLADLPGLLAESQQAGTRVRFDNRLGELGVVPTHVGRAAYRIVQEGLTNARKHAAGTVVDLTLTGAAGDALMVQLRNPAPVAGGPTESIPGSGAGLVGLAERASLAGGRLEHGPTGDGGYQLRAWLPWPA